MNLAEKLEIAKTLPAKTLAMLLVDKIQEELIEAQTQAITPEKFERELSATTWETVQREIAKYMEQQ